MTTNSPFPNGYLEDVKNVTAEKLNLIKGDFAATRFFHGPWANRFDFIFGYLMQPISVAGGITQFAVPQAYPDLPIAHVDSVTVKGEGKASVNATTDAPVFDRARIKVDYKQHNFSFAAEPITALTAYQNNIFIEEEHDQYSDVLQVNGDEIEINGAAGDADDKYEFPLSQGDLTLTQQFIINPDFISLNFFKNKVNGTPFITPSGHIYNTEKLMYVGYTATSKINVTNLTGENFPFPVWEVTHRFAYNAIGWNSKYDFATGAIVSQRDGAGKRFFKLANLMDIFFYFTGDFGAADYTYLKTRLDIIENLLFTEDFPFGFPAYATNLNEIKVKLRDMGFRV